nr:uncharacterized protein LOC129263972 [Lytechinus pictus]
MVDNGGRTALHLAAKGGHLDITECLISEGADVNKARRDKLNTKISYEYYNGRLSPNEALVFYLIENGARLDVKDEAGNLPIHYAKDELSVRESADRPSTFSEVSAEVKNDTSQEIKLQDHGISMCIPPGAVPHDDSCQITLAVMRDNPGVDIPESESMACYGIRCDPQTLIFNQPVKITIPHSCLVVNPQQVKPDIVCRVWDSIKDEPVCQIPSEQTNFRRTLEEVKKNDLQSDIDVLTIAQTMDVNQFYDLGIALGFTIAELDRVEHMRFRDRQQAAYDTLMTWKRRQTSTQEAKSTLITFMESFNSSSNDTTFPGLMISFFLSLSDFFKFTLSLSSRFHLGIVYTLQDIDPTKEIPDSTLLQFARHISKEKFYEIGVQLGFDEIELHHIEHRSLYNRKDANIQMLSMWKASQISSDKPDEKLKTVWKSLKEASKATDMNDDENRDEDDGEIALDPEVNADPSPQQEPAQDEEEENEDWKIIEYLGSDKDEIVGDFDEYGGSPGNSELCAFVRPVANVTLALQVAKALRLDVNDIISLIAPRDPALMERLAWQLLHQWCKRLGRQEKGEKMAALLQGYNIGDTYTGIGEISAKIRTTPDLIDLTQRLVLPPSEILQVMSSDLTFEPTLIRRVILQMLQRWVKQGGTRLRLLEIAQAFNFPDAAEHIATAMQHHPGFFIPFTNGLIDHDGGELKLENLGIRVSIPSGAISNGMRSLVTLTVLKGSSSKLPLDPGEVLITPTIQCSFIHDLFKPAVIALPHCITPDQYQQKKQDLRVKLYSKIGPGEFGYRALLPESSRDFETSEDRVTFSTRHLQYFALSSNDIHGVQFICEVSQPLFMSNPPQPTLRIYIAHPYNKDSVVCLGPTCPMLIFKNHILFMSKG